MNNLAGEKPAGAVDFGGSAQAASAGYPVGAIHFGPTPSSLWEEQPSLRELYDQACQGLVRAECEADELRAEVAMLREQSRILAEERDEARVQYRSTEALAMALVKTIDELKTEKAELVVKLVNLEGRSRRATLDEIAESVRDKYDPEYEREEIEN
jgi:chromosome segregation ATPase